MEEDIEHIKNQIFENTVTKIYDEIVNEFLKVTNNNYMSNNNFNNNNNMSNNKIPIC